MSKVFEWKFDARELMNGTYLIPKRARIFRHRKWAEVTRRIKEQSAEPLILRV